MNLVETIARMIDAEGAYAVFYNNTSADAAPCEPTTRQKYFRAHYECKAIEILKLMAGQTPKKIRNDLIKFEKDGWKRLFEKHGISLDQIPDFEKIITEKYNHSPHSASNG